MTLAPARDLDRPRPWGALYCRLARLRDACALKASILDRNILQIGEAFAQ